jgi:glucokinase
MPSSFDPGASKLAVIADVGRRAVRLGLTDDAGRLRRETIFAFAPSEQSTISGALSAFGQRCALERLPRRCAIAVSGAAVGDVIPVTNSRWFVSRSGLTAMLQAPPLILNDFAAHAWAISAADGDPRVDAMAGAALNPAGPGTRCLIGVGTGLGVAVVTQSARGVVNVLPTEAGHCHFMDGLPELEPVLRRLRKTKGAVTAEDLISARGLYAIYQTVLEIDATAPRATDGAGVIDLAVTAHDGAASRAAELFCRALWYFAGNMALAYGAWDGVMLTGSVAHALRGLLRLSCFTDSFVLNGPYHRQLRDLPRAMVSLDHAELHGAAQALLLH